MHTPQRSSSVRPLLQRNAAKHLQPVAALHQLSASSLASCSSSTPTHSNCVSVLRAQTQQRQQQRRQQRQQPQHRQRVLAVVYASPHEAAAESSSSSSTQDFAWEEDFDLLSNKVAEVNKALSKDLRGCSIFIIGMMGEAPRWVALDDACH